MVGIIVAEGTTPDEQWAYDVYVDETIVRRGDGSLEELSCSTFSY